MMLSHAWFLSSSRYLTQSIRRQQQQYSRTMFSQTFLRFSTTSHALKDFEQLPAKNTFRQKFNIPSDKKIILFLSRINLKKGLDLLLPAFQKIATVRNDCKLVMAGPDDGYLAETEQFIKEHRLQDSEEVQN